MQRSLVGIETFSPHCAMFSMYEVVGIALRVKEVHTTKKTK
jgi:hypothetical protein